MASEFRAYYIIIITGLNYQQELIVFLRAGLYLGIHFQEPKYIDITVKAGTSYYLKYDEENKMERGEHTGPFMLMQDNIGRREISILQSLNLQATTLWLKMLQERFDISHKN